jgi:molybdenum transport protein
MVFVTESEVDRIIEEDVPYFDLTTYVLGIGDVECEISFSSRHEMVVCGTEECKRVLERLEAKVIGFVPSGKLVGSGEVLLKAVGRAESIHKSWKVCQNILEYASGVATRTRRLVSLAKKANPNVEVVTTRKVFPLTKRLNLKGILSGGAMPHRLGLSETVLIFQQHLNLMGGIEEFLNRFPEIKRRIPEKKIILEVKTVDDALKALREGIDIVQLDKFSVEDVKRVVSFRDSNVPGSKVTAAGGINEENIGAYASTGIDLIVLTCAYFGKPADIEVRIEKC